MIPAVTKPAPAFELRGYQGNSEATYSLGQFNGRWLVLWFYYENYAEISHDELEDIERLHHRFDESSTTVLAISKNSVAGHKGWLEQLGGLSFPLLSDPSGIVATEYGVLSPHDAGLLQGTFIINPEGIVAYASVTLPVVKRSAEELLTIIKALQAKK